MSHRRKTRQNVVDRRIFEDSSMISDINRDNACKSKSMITVDTWN